MSFDRAALARLVAAHGRVARVVVAAAQGSVPREPGAAMLVWAAGQDGTIGGGALELQAAETARALLAAGGTARVDRLPLGPALGQCCGGAVTLATEIFDRAALAALPAGAVARRVEGGAEMPLAIRQALKSARGEGRAPAVRLLEGWLIEPERIAQRPVWIFGAGHVGRALVAVLAPLPDLDLTWIDTAPERFPDLVPETVTVLHAAEPARLVTHAPAGVEVLILTYSHALDLALCHAALAAGIGRIGLIGSATKRARFRKRLAELGHPPAAIDRIACPIGDPALGKHPQAIAVGVAAALLRNRETGAETRQGRNG